MEIPNTHPKITLTHACTLQRLEGNDGWAYVAEFEACKELLKREYAAKGMKLDKSIDARIANLAVEILKRRH